MVLYLIVVRVRFFFCFMEDLGVIFRFCGRLNLLEFRLRLFLRVGLVLNLFLLLFFGLLSVENLKRIFVFLIFIVYNFNSV